MRKTLLTAVLAAGVFGIPVAQAQDTVKIGALYNLTGGMSSIDAPALHGAQLAAKLINEKGGVNGQKIEIVSIDTKTDQQAAALGAKNVLSSNVIAGIGALRTHVGTAHGRERGYRRADERIARLAVNSACAVGLFIVETWEKKYPQDRLAVSH